MSRLRVLGKRHDPPERSLPCHADKTNEQGVLEAYVLLSRADERIARDYAGYRKAHRDQLRRYLGEYVVPHEQ